MFNSIDKIIRYLILFFIVTNFYYCTDNKTSNTNTETVKPKKIDTTKRVGPPKFEFESISHDFGNITRGETVAYSFHFKNVGAESLIINSVKASCGCTVVNYDKKPVASNEESFIEIVFDSQGFRGSQYKTVTVTANTQPNETELTISAVVIVTE